LKKILFFLVCLACLLSFSGFPGAGASNEELVVVGEKRLDIQAQHLRESYPEIRANIENSLGWKLLSPPTVLLIADREIFEKMSGSPLISAFAIPSRHSIVIHLSSATSEAYVLHETFEHELCHLLLHDHIKDGLLPKWLDEGICQWVSGSLGEILAGMGTAASGIKLLPHPIPLQQLTVSFPGERGSLIQAYQESRLFVEYLVAQYGKGCLLDVLKHLKEGAPIDQAFSQAFPKSLPSLEEEWLKGLGSRSLWLLWVSEYLYEILFVFGALLTVVAFIRVMIRKRNYDPGEEDEE
jgi:hypothetical protein